MRRHWTVRIKQQALSYRGDVIPGAGSLRKVRWKRDGMGKSAGARVIYYTRLAHGEVVLVAIYAKAKLDNIPVEVLKSWKEAYDA